MQGAADRGRPGEGIDLSCLHGGAVVLAACLWGTLGPMGRLAYENGATPATISLVRGLVACGLVGGWAFLRCPSALRFRREEVPELAAYGLFGMALLYVGYNLAVVRIPVGVAVLLFYTSPLWVILGTVLLRKERLTPLRGLALLLGLGGVWFAVGGRSALSGHLDLLGVLGALASGASYAVYVLGGRYGLGRTEPFRMFLQAFLWGTGALLVYGAAFGGAKVLASVRPAGWGVMVYMGALPTVGGYALLLWALRKVPSTVASLVSMSEIAFALLWAWLILGEVPSRGALQGGALIVASVALLSLEGRFGEAV